MRTIELREYYPTPARLNSGEVRQLLATGLVDLKPLSGEGEYELKAGSVVGTVVLPSLRLLIRPKVGLKNVFFLLGYGVELTSWAEEQFPYEREPDLLEVVARIFEAEVSRAARQGLVRGYQARYETLTTLRGRIDIAGQIRARQDRPFPLECSFEEYTEDIEINRVIKAALKRCLQIPALNSDLIRMLRFRYRFFEAVASLGYDPRAIPEVNFSRLNEHWRPATELARLILSRESLRDEAGKVLGISFTVDMNTLFERFIEKVVGQEARAAGLQLIAQAPRRLSANVPIKPDLVLRAGGADLAVGDAKYKEPDNERPLNEDLYQLLAYCVSLGLKSGLLIYSGTLSRQYLVNQANVTLKAVGVDLTGEPEHIEASARKAAKRLVEHAGIMRGGRNIAHGPSSRPLTEKLMA